MTATSKINSSSGGPESSDVLLLGAAGNSGHVIAAELAARGLSLRLAGRRREPLDDLASSLTAAGAKAEVRAVDIADQQSLEQAITGAGVVLSVIGPFTRLAGPVIDASLSARVPYVDIANEWAAVRGLLDRGEEARDRDVALVTGAGFGPAATEALVLRLVEHASTTPAQVRVAAAAAVSSQGEGVRQTIQESLSQGAITYRDGQVVRDALGSGATLVTFGGAQRQVLPGPVGDLETARLASGAPSAIAYIENPASRGGGSDSWAWAEVTGQDGSIASAELRTGDGVRATAAIAAETAKRVLAGVAPGAWTPGSLLGAGLVFDATGAQVTMNGRSA